MPAPLTIGLPVYNGDRYLRDALDSLAQQSFGDYELVISDNASTDGTESICREVASSDRRIRYIRQPQNMGGAWNFNFVFGVASSPLFKWITHDDLMAPTMLERCLTVLESTADDVILAYPRTVLIDAEGSAIGDFEDRLDLPDSSPHLRLRRYLDNYEMSNAIFGIIRRPLMERTSLLGSYASSDKVLMAEMALAGRFVEIPDRLFLRRYHEGMSRKANVTPEDIAAWFDPNQPRPVAMTRTKLFVEYSRAISRFPDLTAAERGRCLRELVAAGGFHEFHVMGGEMKRELRIAFERWRRRRSVGRDAID